MGKQLARRATLIVAAALALTGTSVVGVLADEPVPGAVDGDGATYSTPNKAQDVAFQAKLQLAAAYERYAATGIWDPQGSARIDYPEPPPLSFKTLDTRARSQNNDWFCGPAAGQVVINSSRSYFYDTLNGEDASKNYKKQSVIAGEMNTTNPDGTDGQGVKSGLNEFVLKPFPSWSYYYMDATDGSQFHSWIVADVGSSGMPLIPGVKPHKADQGSPEYYLPNWANESAAKHWIVIRGYNGLWDGTNVPDVYYSDSTHGAGRYTTGALTMWKVTSFLWGGTAVW